MSVILIDNPTLEKLKKLLSEYRAREEELKPEKIMTYTRERRADLNDAQVLTALEIADTMSALDT